MGTATESLDSDIHWSCSARVDLLGFANPIFLTNGDIRAQAGSLATDRLSSLERALNLLEEEKTRYPHLYPKGLHYIRINDALFLGVDAKYLSPPPGQATLTGGFTAKELRSFRAAEEAGNLEGTFMESAADVAKFLGLVARVHEFVNKQEASNSLPGCRTVVASGLRKDFKDRRGQSDFFAANLSLSVAFNAQEQGSRAGLEGNHFYVDDDVAIAPSLIDICHAIIAMSKFLRFSYPSVDPFQYYHEKERVVISIGPEWVIQEPVRVRIFNQHHVMRQLNSSLLTNLQLFEDYQRLVLQGDEKDQRYLYHSTPTLKQMNESFANFLALNPFQGLFFGLDTDYGQFFGEGSVHADNA